ncbi:MAG: secretin N-terminal domain-containing protein [Candidatus Omnitrophota bacterium]
MRIPRIFALFFLLFCVGRGTAAFAIDIDTSSPFVDPQYSKRISMDFEKADLVDVLKIFSQQSGLNLVASSALQNQKVTVYLDQVPVELALEQILRANDLTYELKSESDIIIVKPLKSPEVEVITRVYQLKHASVSSAKMRSLLSISTEEGGSGSEDTEGVVEVLEKILTSDGIISEDPRTNSIIVTDIATNFPQIEQTIARLDVVIPQILIEVEMLEVDKSLTDSLGVQWGDTPLVVTGGVKSTAFPWDGSIPFFDEDSVDFGSGRLTTGTVSATGLKATMQFLRTDTDTKNLARPRILTLNNETAQIKISTDEAIGTKTITSGTEGITEQSVEAERVETGVILTVTPQANLDTQEITMAIVPKIIIAASGETFAGVTFRNPEERGAQSLLRVMSGDTIVIGGLMREDITDTLTKVPIFGDLPILGSAFRHRSKSITERELIIFITPHILEDRVPVEAKGQRPRIVREQEAPSAKSKGGRDAEQ